MKNIKLTEDHLKNVVKFDFSLLCHPPCPDGQRCVEIHLEGGGFQKTCINIEDFLSVLNGEKKKSS